MKTKATVLTPHEAADELKVSVDTIRRAYRSGDLPAIRMNTVVRIRRVDFDRWVERHVRGAA